MSMIGHPLHYANTITCSHKVTRGSSPKRLDLLKSAFFQRSFSVKAVPQSIRELVKQSLSQKYLKIADVLLHETFSNGALPQ